MTVEKDIREIVQLGETIYRERVIHQVDPRRIGKYLSIDVETGDWEVADDLLTTTDRLHAMHAGALLYSTRVGYPALAKMGSQHWA